MLDLLWGAVHLLLPLFSTTTEAEDKMESGFLLDIVIGEGAAILKLFAGKDQTLLVWWDSFLVFEACQPVFSKWWRRGYLEFLS